MYIIGCEDVSFHRASLCRAQYVLRRCCLSVCLSLCVCLSHLSVASNPPIISSNGLRFITVVLFCFFSSELFAENDMGDLESVLKIIQSRIENQDRNLILHMSSVQGPTLVARS